MRLTSDSSWTTHQAKRLIANGAIGFGTVCVLLSSMNYMAQAEGGAILPAAQPVGSVANELANMVPARIGAQLGAAAALPASRFGSPVLNTPALPAGQALLSVKFVDTPVAEIVKMISESGNVQIIINGDVTAKLQFINLIDATPEQAIEKVAAAAGLSWRKLEDNTYVIATALPPGLVNETGPAVISPIPVANIAPDGKGITMYAPRNLDALPKLLEQANYNEQNNQTEEDTPLTYQYIKLRNVTPRMMAWWIDPAHNPKPLEILQSEENVRRFFDHRLALPAIGGSANMNSNQAYTPNFNSPYGSAGDIDPNNPNPAGSWNAGGYGQFPQPYTQDNAQFGFGGGNNNNNGGGNNFGGNNNNNGGGNNFGGQNGGRGGGGRNGGRGGQGLFKLPKGIDSIVAVDPQNALLVYGTNAGLQQLQTIINYLDLPLRQVEIEAQFVDVGITDTNAFGIDFSSSNGPFSISSTGNSSSSQAGSFNFSFVRNNFALTLNALIAQNRAKVVTAPRVTAINNLTATLTSASFTPVVTTGSIAGIGGQVASNQTVTYVPAQTTLYVTPTINNDDTITVRMQPQVSSTSNPLPGTNAPFISQQFVDTTAVVHDGDTIALGGLRTKNIVTGGTRIPILSSIPIIGALFRTHNNNDSERELIIFVTARIIRRADDDLQIPNT